MFIILHTPVSSAISSFQRLELPCSTLNTGNLHIHFWSSSYVLFYNFLRELISLHDVNYSPCGNHLQNCAFHLWCTAVAPDSNLQPFLHFTVCMFHGCLKFEVSKNWTLHHFTPTLPPPAFSRAESFSTLYSVLYRHNISLSFPFHPNPIWSTFCPSHINPLLISVHQTALIHDHFAFVLEYSSPSITLLPELSF